MTDWDVLEERKRQGYGWAPQEIAALIEERDQLTRRVAELERDSARLEIMAEHGTVDGALDALATFDKAMAQEQQCDLDVPRTFNGYSLCQRCRGDHWTRHHDHFAALDKAKQP